MLFDPSSFMLSVALFACATSAPLPSIMSHKNIIMTLHGLMDHVDVRQLERDNGSLASDAYASFVASVYDPIEPKHCTGEDSNHVRAEIARLYTAIDIDKDQRLMLDEACAFFIAAVVAQSETVLHKAEWQFAKLIKRFGTEQLQLRQLVSWTHPGQLSDDGLLTLFATCDVNENGQLDKEEFIHYYAPEFSFYVLKDFAMRFLETNDADNDGHLDQNEFLNATVVIDGEGNDHFSAQAFDFRSENKERRREFEQDLDVNRNGFLESGELVALADPRHFLHAVNQAYVLFRHCDVNGDHELDMDELQQCCESVARVSSLNLERELHANLDDVYSKLDNRLSRLVNNHLHDEL
eukprot:TRINITY_DN10093_c0_g2_i1.p1 TRINITY_DN10093_c0_g2~~TRINITY_DN10093_c0_g2_i1.p1  ORF type:complete len:352 (+),score=68.66 TRINITY_DN10093_c0_g2_i1:98-1153(+)